MYEVHKGAAPFDFAGKQTSILLIHGFTGSPYEMRPLGEYLANRGFRVKGIRLPGHGTCPEDMLTCTGQDWLKSCRAALWELAAERLPVVVIGLSMGGTLSLLTAASEHVSGIVTMCAPVYLSSWLLSLVPVARLFKQYHQVLDLSRVDVLTKEARPVYDRVPIRSAVELIKLLRNARVLLPQVQVPALVVQSSLDKTVPPGNGRFILKHLGSRQKSLLTVYKSGHVVTLGADREEIFEAIHRFVAGLVQDRPQTRTQFPSAPECPCANGALPLAPR